MVKMIRSKTSYVNILFVLKMAKTGKPLHVCYVMDVKISKEFNPKITSF